MSPGGFTGRRDPNPVTVRLVELLEYGGEVGMEREALIREASKVIPPGRAIREAERTRRKAGGVARKTPEERQKPRSDDRLIQYGRRALVITALRNINVEQYADADGVRWVRLLSVPPVVAYARAQAEKANMADTVPTQEER